MDEDDGRWMMFRIKMRMMDDEKKRNEQGHGLE